ncbi:MAG: hypothetical protein V1790_17690 [Planctomycetota bacterium]
MKTLAPALVDSEDTMLFDNLDDYHAEHLPYAGGTSQPLPDADAQPDTERTPKLDAERVTLQFRVKSARTLRDLSETPLFGGPRQMRLL